MKYCFLLLFVYCLMGCAEADNTKNQSPASQDSTNFYPIASFFENQLSIIPTMKKGMYVISTSGDKKDSAVLTIDTFKILMQEFISKDLTNVTTKQHYRETVFHDASTSSYTLSYTPVDTGVTVQGMDILLDEQTNQVQRVFIRTMFRRANETIMEQHNWNTAKGFQIIRSSTNAQGYTNTNVTEVRWE